MEILNLCTHCDEILFKEDGSWSPMQPKRVKQEPLWSSYSGADAGGAAVQDPFSRRRCCAQRGSSTAEVIDLTLDSSSDEEEPPVKRHCHVVTSTHLASVNKQFLSLHQLPPAHQSPASTAVSTDYLPSLSIPEYQLSYHMPPLPSDFQGLDLFSFLQVDNQNQRSVISSSSDELDPMHASLSHFFPFTSSPQYLEPLLSPARTMHGSAGRSSSSSGAGGGGGGGGIISGSIARDNGPATHTETGATAANILDVISLD
ncbi:E3 SUMO-protein ligase PIAS1-like [Leucoraja erinacea]|uniref:E3 SUMO-protein ligase PIAS1-like n=1 Tax=Leucoraja erinaceus TaxID=7782 RepID=UPI002455A828|nr:E3 SUMO-protein ligase PIAS1-like [Leucoraja erinacea]